MFKEYKFHIQSLTLILEKIALDNRQVAMICPNNPTIFWQLLG